MTLGLFSLNSCIKKKEPTSKISQASKPGAAAKQTPAQIARQKALAARKAKSAVKPNTAGKPVGYWPALRQHLGLDFPKLLKLKNSEGNRIVDLAKAGADAGAVNSKYDNAAKAILGPQLFAKMQTFEMK